MSKQKKGNPYLVRARRQENQKFATLCMEQAKDEDLQPEESTDYIFGAIVQQELLQNKDIDIQRKEPNLMLIQDKTEK